MEGVKESSTRSTESIHIAHLLRVIGSKTNVRAITTETLQGYVNARAKEKGRGRRCVSHVTIQKELGTLSSVWNRWAQPLKLVAGPASDQGADLREGPCQASVPDERPDRAPARTWRALDRRSQRSMGQPFPDHRPGARASGPTFTLTSWQTVGPCGILLRGLGGCSKVRDPSIPR